MSAGIQRPPVRTFSDFLTLGHSLAGSYGATVDEMGWPSRLATALGAELQDRHVDGAGAALDDTTNSGDGGWATAASYLDPQNVNPPWAARNPLTSIYLGHNDDIFGNFTAATRAAMKASIRGAIGHARAAARFNDNDATVRTTGASETGAGSWTRGTPAAVQYSMNAQFSFTTAANDEIHIDVPAGQPINAIWIYTLTGGGVSSTLNGAVLANASSAILASAASFPSSGSGKVIDTSIAAPSGPEDFFTWGGKSTNTLTGIPTSGANALLAHNSGLTVVNLQGEGGAFTVDVDGVAAAPPTVAGVVQQAFDTRNLGFQVSPARINGHGWRIPIPADGLAHEVTIKVTALTTAFYFDGWEIEATTPPIVMLPMPIRGYWYELYTGYQYVPSDSTITSLRDEITELAAEFDRYVFTVADYADTQLGKAYRNFYQPVGSTTSGTLSAGAVTVGVSNTANFAAAGGLATIVDAGTPDTFSYTARSVVSGAGNLTGVPATGAFAVIAHGSSGLKVAPTDGMHLSDEGHEIMAAAVLDDLNRKVPRDTRTIIASQRHRGSYGNRDLWKQPVRVAAPAATGNVSIAAPPTTLDGVTLVRNNRILLPFQTNPAENGIYRYFGGAPPLIRDSDANGNDKLIDGTRVRVVEGAVNHGTEWALVTNNPIVIGTTSLRWRKVIPPEPTTLYRSAWEPSDTASRPHVLSNLPRWAVTAQTIAALVSGRMTVVGGVTVPAGQTITAITFFSGTTAAGTPTNQWFALLSTAAAPVVLQRTTNDTTTAWAVSVPKTLALQATWTPDSDTLVWVAIVVTATTVPTLSGSAGAEVTGLGARALLPVASSSTGLTTPSAVGAVLSAPASLAIARPYVLLT
jgi:lysophospholipase L1-like esterase